jgi:predicted ATPase
MKIEQLTLENFKCFKTEKTFDFSRLTILTGANSSGKSSVIHAILLALQSQDFPNNLSTNGDFVQLGDFKEISNNHNSKNLINLSFKVITNSRIHNLMSLWKENNINFLPTIHDFEKKITSKTTSIEHSQSSIKLYKFGRELTNYIGAFRSIPRRTYLEQNKKEFKINTEGDGYLDQIVEWDKLSNGKMKELVKTMMKLDLIEDIKIRRLSGGIFEVLVKPTNSNVLTSLANVGFGVSQFMPIIVADLQLPNNSTLFLAEPEIHLHPSIQSKFGDYIVNNINNTDKNYVIETHSEYFLNKIRLAIVKGELKKEDVKVYFLENSGDDTDVFDIDFTKTGAIKNAPPNFFRTYFLDTMDIALNSFAE